jgi:TRAP-type C4-dicarboxylate transport system permease small subunit
VSGNGRRAGIAERLVAIVSLAGQAIAALACLACFALVCWAVAMRYFFNSPQSWSDEAVGWLVVVVVMLAAPEAQRRGENVGVDWLVDSWTGARRRAVIGLGSLSVAIVAAVLIWEGWETVAFTRMIGIKSNQLPEVPLWAVQALIPIGGVLLLLVAIVQIGVLLRGREPDGYERREFDPLE